MCLAVIVYIARDSYNPVLSLLRPSLLSPTLAAGFSYFIIFHTHRRPVLFYFQAAF